MDIKKRPVAYEGKKPYIFISYAHKDEESVIPAIAALQEAGFPVWYDAGIQAGSEWPEYIAEHLLGSALVVAFVSQNAVASKYCKREVTFAVSNDKPMLTVKLDAHPMPPGLAMQLELCQTLNAYLHPNADSYIRELVCAPFIAHTLAEAAGGEAEIAAISETPSTPSDEELATEASRRAEEAKQAAAREREQKADAESRRAEEAKQAAEREREQKADAERRRAEELRREEAAKRAEAGYKAVSERYAEEKRRAAEDALRREEKSRAKAEFEQKERQKRLEMKAETMRQIQKHLDVKTIEGCRKAIDLCRTSGVGERGYKLIYWTAVQWQEMHPYSPLAKSLFGALPAGFMDAAKRVKEIDRCQAKRENWQTWPLLLFALILNVAVYVFLFPRVEFWLWRALLSCVPAIFVAVLGYPIAKKHPDRANVFGMMFGYGVLVTVVDMFLIPDVMWIFKILLGLAYNVIPLLIVLLTGAQGYDKKYYIRRL